MLTIPRKKGESLVIGDNIIITVVEIQGDKVQLSIERPEGVTVHGREVYDAVRRPEPVSE